MRAPNASNNIADQALRIFATALAVALVGFVSTTQQVSNDFWLQAKIGALILHENAIPETVLFPFTEIRDSAFNAHEWLPSILFDWILTTFGETSLPFISGLLGCILFALIVRLAYRKSNGNLPVALAFGLLALAAENYRHVLRPELMALIFLVLCLECLRSIQVRYTNRSAALFLIWSALWANTHGSFVLAPMLAMACGAGCWLDQRQEGRGISLSHPATIFFGLALGAFLCTLVNPFGLNIWKFVLNFTQAGVAKAEIIEWIPTLDPRLRPIRGTWIGLATIGIGLSLLWKTRDKISHVDAIVFLLFLGLMLQASRFLVYAGIAASFAFSGSPAINTTSSTRAFGVVVFMTLVLWGGVLRFGNATGVYPYSLADQTKLTPAMVYALSDPAVQGNVLNSYALGAELIYRTYPRLRPSIDSRIDSYGDHYFYMHESLLRSRLAMNEFVRRHAVRFLLLDLADLEIVQSAGAIEPGQWKIRLMDRKAILLERITSTATPGTVLTGPVLPGS